MTFEWWLTYFVASVVLSLSPGSGAINTMSIGMTHGFRQAVVSIAGLQCGLAVQIVAVGIGLGTLIAGSATAFAVLKWLGAGYLVWLGIQQWRSAGVLVLDRSRAIPHGGLFRRAIYVNLSNPKSIVFLAALFPQFVMPGVPLAGQYGVLGITTVAVDSCVMLGYAALASQVARWISTTHRATMINRIFGLLFVLVGVLLACAHHNG